MAPNTINSTSSPAWTPEDNNSTVEPPDEPGSPGLSSLDGIDFASSDIKIGKRVPTRMEREMREKLVRKYQRKMGKPQIKPIKNEKPKVGRNDKCSCGSEKKYKHCCAL